MAEELQSGVIVDGRYQLEARVGSGGFGEVWRAKQLGVERPVAVKFLHLDVGPGAERRFEREARALGALSHPNCVMVHDFGRDLGRLFLATAFVEGSALTVWRTPDRTLNELLEVAAQAADAVRHAHKNGILHRDIKPANILVTEADGKLHVTVVDFGLACVAVEPQGDITETGRVVGTPGYISPEQLLGDPPDASSDLYSLGVLVFWLVEQQKPFEAETSLKIAQRQVMETAPALSSDAPQRLRQVVAELLDRDPNVRLTHATDLGAQLRQIAAETPVSLVAPSDTARRTPPAPVSAARVPAVVQQPIPAHLPTRVGAVALGFLGVAAVAGIAGVLSRTHELPAEQPAIDRVKAVVASTPPAASGRTVVLPQPLPSVAQSSGCAADPQRGLVTLNNLDGLTSSKVRAYIPSSYVVGKRHPVVIMLHDALQSPNELLSMTGFAELADRDGVVLLLPEHDSVRHVWHLPSAQKAVPRLLELADSKLCLDPKQTMLFGFGAGGTGVSDLRCLMPHVAAVAASAHRRAPGELECEGIEPTRFLLLSPTAGFSPVKGGSTCLGSQTISLAHQEAMIGETNQCEDQRSVVSKHGKSECFTWNCAAEFISCHIDGGRPWPGSTPKNPCEGQPARYPYRDQVWGFFFPESGAPE